ncbi:MAG: DUF1576 domain-containing protein [Oscillospiraceae bacterium]|nr:DUF1576 domain-containing protein [Oscillospiraceae bacterium]
MKKLNNLSESKFLKLFFAFVSVAFLVGAVFMPDRDQMFTGFWKIMTSTCKISTNYFALGGFAATFLNMAIVGLFCTALCCLPGAKPNNVTTLGVLLTLGFGSWGMNLVNMIPTVLGVCLYALVKKEKLGAMSNAMLFSTGIAPLISDLLFRYPGTEYLGFNGLGLAIGLFVGLIIGFFLPAGLAHSPNVHKGYDHYSAALPVGMTAFFLRAVLYKVLPGNIAELSTMAALDVNSFKACNIFAIALFVLFIIFALLMGCKLKDYWNLMKDSGHSVSFTAKYGFAPFLMNAGVFGLMIVAYFNFAAAIDTTATVSGAWTGMTFGIVFCMLSTCNSGSHPRNVLPIMLGYIATSYLFGWIAGLLGAEGFALTIGSQSILIGLCYANGLSPIAGKYGFGYGILAGGLHYLLVSAVPDMHGGFLLYNGGFTAALICLVFVPQLERFCKTKEEKKALKVK